MHLCMALTDDETRRLDYLFNESIEISLTRLRAMRGAEMDAEADEIKRDLRVLRRLRKRIRDWQDAKEATRERGHQG